MADDQLTALLIEDGPPDALLLRERLASGRAPLEVLHAGCLKGGRMGVVNTRPGAPFFTLPGAAP